MSDLDSVFDKHDARMRKEQEARNRKNASEAERGENAGRVLLATVLPVLKQVAEAARLRGHSAEVKERLNLTSFPSVELELSPVDPTGWHKTALPSSLEFKLNEF